MKSLSTVALLLPVLILASGCALLPGSKKVEAPEPLVITEPEVPAQIQSTFLEGDTLWDFAERTTGSGFNWERIKEFNSIADEKNIDSGIVLLVPPELALDEVKNQ